MVLDCVFQLQIYVIIGIKANFFVFVFLLSVGKTYFCALLKPNRVYRWTILFI